MIGKLLAGRYRLVEQVGVGGMAIVYRAIDENTGHYVAVKLLRPDLAHDASYVTRFQREAEAASKMTHHNIVNLTDVGMDGDNRFLVMEFVSGRTLKQIIQEKGRLSSKSATQITIRILSALQHAHENGIIHRDIKPQNILVNTEGHVKVADFGIARIANSATLTKGDVVMGSVHYFSPEQASGQPADARSDIYSVGVVLYEMLTGKVPFDGDNQVAIAMQHIHNRPTPIEQLAPEVPASLNAVCMKALAKNPVYRYQTAKEMASDLALVMDGKIMPPVRTDLLGGVQGISPDTGENLVADTGENENLSKENRKKDNSNKKKINWPWWIFTVLTVLLILLGLYWGGTAIYEGVINSTEVPSYIGMDMATALKESQKMNLRIEEIHINHPTASEGTVVMQAPGEGTILRKGDAVVVTVSDGPASVEVPAITGMTLQDAITAAQNKGLIVTVVERVTSSEIQSGFVMGQVPEAGKSIKSGETIQVIVSGGLAIVPDVKGFTFPEATKKIAQAGLSLSDDIQFIGTNDESLHNLVKEQSIVSGTQVIQGTEIILHVYQAPTRTCSQQVTINLPDATNVQNVRLTLEKDGSEYSVFKGDLVPNEQQEATARIFSQEAGKYNMRVYINGEFKYQAEVQME
ncbi:MAG: Stk1 family PASTA domain-containing Ser/Thr kinase [Clostridia bacterium]|nr:Stk1 family PASTA domain-containing Ser/Thr kinase [Clostridia bacterium]